VERLQPDISSLTNWKIGSVSILGEFLYEIERFYPAAGLKLNDEEVRIGPIQDWRVTLEDELKRVLANRYSGKYFRLLSS
jgi:hypothetical protein